MPLPDATPPDQSRLYEQLKTSKLEDLTDDQLDSWRDQIFAESENEDEIRRLILLYLAAGRLSIPTGPIIRSAEVTETEITYAEAGAATGYKIHLQPWAGELWRLMAASAAMTGGTVGCSIMVSTGIDNITTIQSPYVLIAQESSTGAPIFDNNPIGDALFFTKEYPLIMQAYSMTTGESVKLRTYQIRVS